MVGRRGIIVLLDDELASIPVPRSLASRRDHARKRLESGFQMWLATAICCGVTLADRRVRLRRAG